MKDCKVLCRTQEEYDKVLNAMLNHGGKHTTNNKSIYNFKETPILVLNQLGQIINRNSFANFNKFTCPEVTPAEIEEYLKPEKRQANFDETIQFVKDHLDYEYSCSGFSYVYLGYSLHYNPTDKEIGFCDDCFNIADIKYRETPQDEWKKIIVK